VERQQPEETKPTESMADIQPIQQVSLDLPHPRDWAAEFHEPPLKQQKTIEENPSQGTSPETPDPRRSVHSEMEIVAAHEKRTAPSKHRNYAPEHWELDTFDELKSFGSAIRQKLSEKHMMLNHTIEDTVTTSLNEITDFMSKCDSELGQLRTDFMMSSVQISNDITQKQKMVEELGSEQSRHIQQMMKDCDVIQRRAEDLLSRFAQQKKTLLANQEKHIALFRDDMLSEVKSAVTKGKRESSKKMVQKLVNLLDEL
jgi:hypothetical protein